MSEPVYFMESVEWPYAGGIGLVAGVPMVRLVLRGQPNTNTERLTVDEVVARVQSEVNAATKWALIDGDEDGRDNELLIRLRVILKLKAFVYVNGESPGIDSSGRLPLWDHVCLVPKVGSPIRASVFHSVIIPHDTPTLKARAFSSWIDKEHPQAVHRYVSAAPDGDTRLAFVLARAVPGWSVTAPLKPTGIIRVSR